MIPRIDVSRNDIDLIVKRFYAKVRVHDVLGPIFLVHVSSSAKAWREHEAKIASFWANAVLGEHEYSGNPMQVHSQVSDIRTEHFAIWLTMFEETLTEVLPTQQAAEFDALARRIGRGLMMGLDYSKRKSPPNLSMGLG